MSTLNGIRILDFSTLLPGPFATMWLADLGAEVVRVEAPGRPDLVRQRPPFDDGVSAGHSFLNRNKRSIAIDLKKPGGADVVKRLVQDFDVVVEQFRPGVMQRLGLDYDTLAAERPDLVYCSLTGYGQNGPLRDRAGHDNNYLSLAGVMSHSGRKDEGPPPLGVQVADLGAGSFGVIIGILAAIVHRQRTGEGQYVDVSMFDGSLMWNAYAAAACLVGGEAPKPEAMPLNGGSHYDFYRTKDGRYFSVGSLESQFWKGFCEAMGHPEWAEHPPTPGPHMDKIKPAIRAKFLERTFDEWRAVFADRDVCVEPVLDLNEAFAHPQTQARGMIVDVPKPGGATQRQVANPLKFSRAQADYRHTGVDRGAHTEAVLREAGFDAAEIDDLREGGVIEQSA